jgi:hypothetical protein
MWEPSFLFERVEARLQPNAAYYAVAQFTRFARPGMQVVEASDTTLKTNAYLDAEGRRLVIVTVNDTETAADLAYDLSALGGVGAIEAWRTSETERLTALPPLPGGSFTTTLPARSITTFVAPYGSLVPPLIANGGFETGHLAPWVGMPAEQSGVQDTYPHGGSFDGYLDLKPGTAGSLTQEITGLIAGARYVLTAACATSGIEARISVNGVDPEVSAATSDGTYRHVRVEFSAPADGKVTVAYSAGPSDEKQPWATIDSVRLSPR